jgi:hypothetical protein
MRAAVFWALSPLLVAGCSKKPEATAKPEPASSASAAPATALTPPEKTPEKPKAALEYRLGHHFDGKVSFFALTTGLLACVDCDIGAKPNNDRHVYFFDGTETKELPNLLSDKRISANLNESVTQLLKPFDGGVYIFSGAGPKQLNLEVYGMKDDDNIERNGAPQEHRYLSFDGKSWTPSEPKYPNNDQLRPWRDNSSQLISLPRKYDQARLHGGGGLAVASDDGPLLLIGEAGHLALWDGKAWLEQAADWKSTGVVQRLAGGRTLVLGDTSAYGIDTHGTASRITLEDPPLQATDLQLLLVENKPWLLSPRNVYVPVEAELRAAPALKREPDVKRPPPPAELTAAASATAATASAAPSAVPSAPATAAPSGSTAPTASVPAAASAAAVNVAPSVAAASASADAAIVGIPAMTGFSAGCKAPFVVLFTPPQPNWSYYEAARNLVDAAPLQDRLWFAEFTRNKVSYFGAQAADEEAARALMAAYVAKVPKAKPILGCLDIKAYLPDPYTPKWDAERILLNIATGMIL